MDDFRQKVKESGILDILKNALPEQNRKVFEELAENKIKEWEVIYKDINDTLVNPKGGKHVEPERQPGSDEEPT